jgi:hypothetical protein
MTGCSSKPPVHYQKLIPFSKVLRAIADSLPHMVSPISSSQSSQASQSASAASPLPKAQQQQQQSTALPSDTVKLSSTGNTGQNGGSQ